MLAATGGTLLARPVYDDEGVIERLIREVSADGDVALAGQRHQFLGITTYAHSRSDVVAGYIRH